MQKRRLGTILILLGALLLAGALGLLGYNQWDNGRAQKAAAQVLDQLETTLDEQENHLQSSGAHPGGRHRPGDDRYRH